MKINNQLFKNNYQIVLLVREIIGWNLIKVTTAKIVNILSIKKNIKLIKKILKQDRDFSTILSYANEKIREIWMNMAKTAYNSTEDMIDKLQELKRKTILMFYKNISNYYDNLNIRFDEDPFAKNVQGISKIYHEVLLLTKFLQTKPQVKNMNIKYCDLYHTVNKNRDEKEIVDNQYANEFICLNDVIIPNQYVGIKDREK